MAFLARANPPTILSSLLGGKDDSWGWRRMSGTQTSLFKIGFGMPDVPATGRKIQVMDALVVTVQGDKVSKVRLDSPADGGLPEILAQLGVKMPGMQGPIGQLVRDQMQYAPFHNP
jgi:hypothetical protein